MTEPQMRRAVHEDCAALEALQWNSFTRLAAAHYTPEQTAAFLRHACGGFPNLVRAAAVWVLEGEHELVACAAWHPAGLLGLVAPRPAAAGVVEVRSVYVREGWTRRGLAGRLLVHVEREAAAHGAHTLRLDAMRGSEAFYAAHGYAPAGEMAFDIAGTAFPGLTMTKRLRGVRAA